MLKISAFYLEKQKVLFLKKIEFISAKRWRLDVLAFLIHGFGIFTIANHASSLTKKLFIHENNRFYHERERSQNATYNILCTMGWNYIWSLIFFFNKWLLTLQSWTDLKLGTTFDHSCLKKNQMHLEKKNPVSYRLTLLICCGLKGAKN